MLRFVTFISGASDVGINSTDTIATETWTHIAVVRESGVWTQYVNGVVNGSQAEGGTPTRNASPLRVGRRGFDGTRAFKGNVEGVRLTKGVARYTGAFTPPAEAFPTTG